MTDVDPQPYLPEYASYNWTGAPSNSSLQTNVIGGDSRKSALPILVLGEHQLTKLLKKQEWRI